MPTISNRINQVSNQQQQQHPNTNSSNHLQPPPSQNTSVQSMDTQFEPLDIIGTGSFGIIRKVRRIHDGLILARKELNYGRMDERDLRQLGEEVNILQNLRGNDHIVKYFERYVDKQNFMLYILMEYCSQGDLAAVISRCRRDQVHLSEDTIWSYLAQITTALLDCHSAEMSSEEGGKKKPIILHRDIKPENVFLNHFGLVKLGDFGLSKAMEMAAFTNTYVGTPYYMSPELINGQKYDVKSDIWALGCLMYELCAWHPPFHQAQTQPELAKLIREGKIPNLPRGYSSQLTALIKSMLRQDPKLRPDAKSILSVEQVKHQIRVLEVHRYARELTKKQTVIEEQEKGLLEREVKLKARETRLQKEKDYFKVQQENHLLLQEEFQVKFQHALEVIERANQIESQQQNPQHQQNENLAPSQESPQTQTQTQDDNGKPGTARRAPLTERRYSFNPPVSSATSSSTPTINYAQPKRLSTVQQQDATMISIGGSYGSPMKLDTPFKHLAPTADPVNQPPLPTQGGNVGSRFVRQVKSSKSLASLKTTSSFLSRLKSSEESDSITTTSDDGPSNGHQQQNKKGDFNSRRLSRRSESANGLLNFHSQEQSQQGYIQRAIDGMEDDGYSTHQVDDHTSHPTNATASHNSSEAPSSVITRSPQYNHLDPESLPSPFLKKKSSASTIVSNLLNRPSTTSTSNASITTHQVSPRKTVTSTTSGRKLPTMFQQIKKHGVGGNNGGQPPSIAARPTSNQKRISITKPNSVGMISSKFLGVRDNSSSSSQESKKVSNHSGITTYRRRENSNLSN
ncbi:NEK protein kinase [Melampsora americana]|nr:NEK protein kinase [Melampsora americana]